MRVSQRLDYTVRLLIALAAQDPDTPVPVGSLATRLGMPRRFLEQQMTLLGKTGIVTCRRGSGGGCSLARPAEDVTLADVIRAVEGTLVDVPHTAGSAATELWAGAERALDDFFSDVTLQDLAYRQTRLESAGETMYFI